MHTKPLNLWLKILFVSNLCLLILLGGIAIGIRQPILYRFARLEEKLMQNQLARIADSFIQKVEKLDSTAKAEAIWTEMYNYMGNPHSTFYKNTYSFEGLANSDLDFLGVFDLHDNPIHLDWVDRQSEQLKPLPKEIRIALLKDRQSKKFPDDRDLELAISRNLTFISTQNQLLLIAACPILNRDAKGPRRGTLITGIIIDEKFLTRLEKNSNFQLHLTSVPPEKLPFHPQISHHLSEILYISEGTHILENQWIIGEIYLLNSHQNPVQILSVQAPRNAYQEGEKTLNLLTAILFLVGIFLGTIISFLLEKYLRNQQLLKRSELALQTANQELEKLAYLDSLTQIANRRWFNDYLMSEWRHHLKAQKFLALILIDIDDFKGYNDYYGHQGGDHCLIQIAQTIAKIPQYSTDLVARYGGEEFAVILPHTGPESALKIAEKIRETISLQKIPHLHSKVQPYVTLSLGVASFIPDDTLTLEALISQADQALYTAKKQGRNRTFLLK